MGRAIRIASRHALAAAVGLVCAAGAWAADPGKIVVQVDKPGATIDPMFYGLMTEEINHSYDGGLYGELIQNRAFKDRSRGRGLGRGRGATVAGTKDPTLFVSERYSMRTFSWKVPNGKYLAKLYFSEMYEGITGPGQRVFSFDVQGHEFKDFDVWVKAGGPNRAYVETVPVEVTNGEFQIVFTPKVENPQINAIEIVPQTESATDGAPPLPTVRIKAGRFEPFTDSSGRVWQPDKGFEGGNTIDRGPAVEAPAASTVEVAPHWSVVKSDAAEGVAALDTSDPVNATALTTSLKLTIADVPDGGRFGVANDGYWGIPVKPDWTYACSFYAKASEGFAGPVTVAIESGDGATTYASVKSPAITGEWMRYQVTLKTGAVEPTADTRFVISAVSKGAINFNLVSLFPPVFKQRTGKALGGRPHTGFRADIMQLLADMNPAYLRFPGGNYLEGSNFANRFNWKTMIGPWEDRPGHMCPWGYRSSDGLGLLEFLEWCEELDVEPLVGVYAGLHLDGGRDVRTGEALLPFIQEALEEIEYITGDATTKWGARRAKDGHPEPFKLTCVEIGNEDWLNNGTQSYQGPEGRYALFYKAIKAKYPDLQVIATVDPRVPHDVIDNHHYMSPNAAIRNAHLYDRADRKGSKIFEGEWASQERGNRRGLTPSFQCALSDAAFLTGLERNADIVVMHCYAPLFTRVNPGGSQWSTDLIGYDTLTVFGSPSYYVQKMFSNAKGDWILPVAKIAPQTIPTPAAEPSPTQGPGGRGRFDAPPSPNEPLFACASKEDASGDVILKVVNIFDVEQTMTVELAGAEVLKNAAGQVMVGQPTDVNSVENPFNVVPEDFVIDDAGSTWTHAFPGNSITVIRFKTR